MKFKSVKKTLVFLIINCVVVSSIPLMTFANADRFIDVSDDHWAKDYIYNLRELNIIQGSINENGELIFGLNKNVTRAEFLTMLVRLSKGSDITLEENNFTDVDKENWFYENVITGIKQGIIIQNEYQDFKFNPNGNITRLEMAKMIVRSMGYDQLARKFETVDLEFEDVTKDKGYIKIAKDLGIINGKYNSLDNTYVFSPNDVALRTEAVAMISRMNDILTNKLKTVHGFYAISSYSQINKIMDFNSLGFGWSSLDFDHESRRVIVSSEKTNNNDYYLPTGYTEPYRLTIENEIEKYLMVYGSNSKLSYNENGIDMEVGMLEYLLNNGENQEELINQMVSNTVNLGNNNKVEFQGLVIDFEGLKNRGDNLAKYTEFLKNLKKELINVNKELIVCLHPIRENRSYYDGYDYEEISKIADKIIIMAHDYNPQNISDLDIILNQNRFPLAPIDEVYTGVTRAIESKVPRDKIILQISLNKEAWTLDNENGSRVWKSSYITYSEIANILANKNENVIYGYDNQLQSAFILVNDNDGQLKKIIWYEDSRSVKSKIKLAQDFGLDGVSIWRIGLIGDDSHDAENQYFLDVWSEIDSILDEDSTN